MVGAAILQKNIENIMIIHCIWGILAQHRRLSLRLGMLNIARFPHDLVVLIVPAGGSYQLYFPVDSNQKPKIPNVSLQPLNIFFGSLQSTLTLKLDDCFHI